MMSTTGRWPIAALLGIAGLVAAGCGSQFASPPRTYPVRGKVVLKNGQVPRAGLVKISINPSWPTARPKDAVAQAKRVVPRKYWSGDTTDIVREVKTEDNVFQISLP